MPSADWFSVSPRAATPHILDLSALEKEFTSGNAPAVFKEYGFERTAANLELLSSQLQEENQEQPNVDCLKWLFMFILHNEVREPDDVAASPGVVAAEWYAPWLATVRFGPEGKVDFGAMWENGDLVSGVAEWGIATSVVSRIAPQRE
ncbi:MAG: hypothetical protein OXK79_07685 [Chloroflexota bacterium]|nr:hypothetical protein [Chloroflexota bacterium]